MMAFGRTVSGALLLLAAGQAVAGAAPAWPEATREMRPWVYNWWRGSAGDEKGLEFQSRELVEKGLAHTDILKVNDEEMRTLGFAPESLFARFPRLKTVVETCGAAGCRVTSRTGEAFDSPAIADGPVVDTIGAGDSFSAAFLAAVLNGKSLSAAAEAGNRLAGKVAARAGAIPEDL